MTEAAEFNPVAGVVDWVENDVRRVLAPNPSSMTYRGTNTYLIGRGEVAVIDPGPPSTAHMEAILRALKPGERISHILVTHSHLDHSPLARPLSQATGAPVLGFGAATAGRSPVMEALAVGGDIGGGEGVDQEFRPDITIADGAHVAGRDWTLVAVHTPGHLSNHLCFVFGDVTFTGDHVMGWASSLISPPDGDMGAYMASLNRLSRLSSRRFYPAHGGPVTEPAKRLSELAAHRRAREAEILRALEAGPAAIPDLTRRIYTDVSPALFGAAERNVFAHLLDLTQRNRVTPIGAIGFSAVFRAL
jgi:glyoxylase-like metal-dependent hydrolase (beta-lactamase superfamily II)